MISGDNFVGTDHRTALTIALAEVSRLEVRRTDPTSTLLLLGIVVGLTVAILAGAHSAAGS